MPPFVVGFWRDTLAPDIREALLSTGRKNCKTTSIAVFLNCHLSPSGPLRQRGWRCGAISLSAKKSAVLWGQAKAIYEASGLEGIHFGVQPRVMRSDWGEVEFLSAEKNAGQSEIYDVVIADELGLFPPKGRELVTGTIGALGTSDGKFIAISVLGHSELTRDLVARRGEPGVAVHLHQAPPDASIEQETAWHKANPGIRAGIKSLDYMRHVARKAAGNPSEQAGYWVFEMNRPGAFSQQMLVPLDRWLLCANRRKPERAGGVYVGLDLGGSVSMTCGALFWPESGRLEVYGGYGVAAKTLLERGEADGVGDRYQLMADAGELLTWPVRVTPVTEFLAWIVAQLRDETVVLAAADRYRKAEALDALATAGVDWPIDWRAVGSGRDGSADIRAFQKAVESQTLHPGESLLLASAIRESVLRFDSNSNPALEKGRQHGRIDALSAAVLAVGIGTRRAASQTEFSFAHTALEDLPRRTIQ